MTRNEYLSFLGKLFQLAADSDLESLHKHASEDAARGAAVTRLIEALEHLTRNTGSISSSVAPKRDVKALQRLLSSRELFSSNEDFARFMTGFAKVPVRDKDSRQRVVARVLRELRTWPDDKVRALNESLRDRARKSSSFVSKWSSVIQDL